MSSYEPYPSSGEPSPYGNNPYGGGTGGNDPYGPGYGGNPRPAPTDAVSITGFVLSLTCVLSIVGAILGFVGLSRTKNGQRRGRWAAISAAIIGPIFTLIAAGLTVLIIYGINQVVTPDNAEVGQCIDVDDEDDDEISLTKAECGESHDAEIVAVAEAQDYDGELSNQVVTAEVCVQFISEEDADSLEQYQADSGVTLDYSVVIEDPDNIDPDDTFVCYVEPRTGSLDEGILD